MADMGFIGDALRISQPLDYGERQITVGSATAYGEVASDGRTYSLHHAPTQGEFDLVAAILDAAEPDQIIHAMRQ